MYDLLIFYIENKNYLLYTYAYYIHVTCIINIYTCKYIYSILEVGKFYNIHVTSSEEYDLTGKIAGEL